MREQVKRGDIAFNKVHGEDMTGLAGVPFKITSKTTGESHIAITDVNGILTTEASACPHTVCGSPAPRTPKLQQTTPRARCHMTPTPSRSSAAQQTTASTSSSSRWP